MKLSDARGSTALRARPDGGFDDVAMQSATGGFWDGPVGVGNVAPFSRVQNKMLKPETINYPIPALGDHRMRWQASFMVPESRKATCY
jgi:hypothetical protein